MRLNNRGVAGIVMIGMIALFATIGVFIGKHSQQYHDKVTQIK